jgi:glycosyltransferase involved in cell wall biosynthesis
MARVLLVGRGRPERGGIPAFLDLLLDSDLAGDHHLELLNLAEESDRPAGRFSSSNLSRAVRDARRVHEAAKGFDVVHVHSALAPAVTMARAGLLAFAARRRGARVIVHAHGGRVQLFLTTALRRRFARVVLAAAPTIVAVSAGAEDALRAALGPRREVVRVDNGVDVARYRPLGEGRGGPTLTILYAGVLTDRKGVLDLLVASDSLAAGGTEHRILLAGGDPPEGREAADRVRAAAAGRADRVELLGPLDPDAMPAAYARADVFCLPSWWEAMPLSVLEARASGVAVVATSVGDVPRVLEDGVTGLLVPPRDAAALAAALVRLAEDPALRRTLATNARRDAETRWNAATTIGRIGELYDPSRHSRP